MTPAEIARSLTETVKRAVLMCPFNSRGAGFKGGTLSPWNEGNFHLSGKPALFVRRHCPDYSGDYSLTPLGRQVRAELAKER